MASNVEGKFQYLIETKELIKGALNEKGLAISDADTFRSYADSIRNAEFKSDDVRYVTFMNGTRQLYVKPVATGDDCVDVKAKGLISTPTKASSVSTVYTYAGWAATNGGAADANVLKAVTADKTVYAAYTAAARYYTITYYDSDGTTVLKTESLAYGSTPSYAPKKDGYVFEGWTVTPVAVTGNASYTAKWSVAPAFATMTWAEISEASANGTASTLFKIGDTREVVVCGKTHTAVIADFNHDDLADGSGKAGLSIVLRNALDTTCKYYTSDKNAKWSTSTLRSTISGLMTSLPSDLQSVIKPVSKVSYQGTSSSAGTTETTTDSLWALSAWELFGYTTANQSEGTTYPWTKEQFAVSMGERTPTTLSGSKVSVWLRGARSSWNRYADSTDASQGFSGKAPTSTLNIYFGFCI